MEHGNKPEAFQAARRGFLALVGCGCVALRPPRTAILIAAFAAVSCLVPSMSSAQDPPVADEEAANDEGAMDGVFLPPDRAAKQRLEQARQLSKDNRYGESVRLLGTMLEGSEDFFFKPNPNQPLYRSLKNEAGRLIGAMPTEGRDSYELQFGARAKRMLSDAAKVGDIAALEEVSRRFFFTQAGGEATLLLARHHLDHSRPLAAALCYDRLLTARIAKDRFEPELSLSLATCWLRAGMSDKAKRVLVDLKRDHPKANLRIAGKPAEYFKDDAQAVAWLVDKIGPQRETSRVGSDSWAMYRGDAQRNAASAGSRPLLNPRWRVRTDNHPSIEKLIVQVRQMYLDQDIAAIPSLHPLAVNDVVLMRTSRNLLAIDFKTGKRIWEAKAAADGAFDQLLTTGGSNFTGRNRQQPVQLQQLVSGLEKRLWDDTTYGTMSSDGVNVYTIEDLELSTGLLESRQMVMVNGRRRVNSGLPKNYNRLTARELRTEGKLKWEVGGATGEDEPKLAGAFFLGPPLPLLGKLYVLAETKGQEIRLVVLSPKTGQMEWSQQLAVVEQNIVQDPFRRSAGAVPSFADGVLVCPTSAGAVVALDLTTRALLWGYQYPRGQATIDRFAFARMGGMYPNMDRRASDRWTDATATISGHHVLLTPVEGDQIYCLNLLDGQLVWKQERGSNLYIGCVHAGNVILVGHHQVTAIKLADGKPAWKDSLELPAGSIPSGRGFYSGPHYYLPLSTAEVAKIDLTNGTIEHRARARRGDIPGNLICFRGEVVSQNVDFVETFYQLDSLKDIVTERLKTQPDDARSLARLGEIRRDEGNLSEAIALLRRSYEIKADDITRQLLVDSLLEGLRTDFAANRNTATELEKLIDQKQQKNVYLRLIAAGLQKSGDSLSALDAYLKLAQQPADSDELDDVAEGLSVRRDRWLQAQLAELRSSAPKEAQTKIDELVAARLKAAEEVGTPAALRAFLTLFGRHPLADPARLKLTARLTGADTLLERETLLRRLESSGDESLQAAAVARMAVLLAEAKQPEQASRYYAQLQGKLADVDCQDGKTGKQLVDELPADSPVRTWLAGGKPWPVGEVVSRPGGSKMLAGPHHSRAFDLDMHGNPGPFFRDMMVSLDQQQQSIVGQDGLGVERFKIQLTEQNARRGLGGGNVFNGFNNPITNYTAVNGHLLLVSMGHQVLALDTLRPREQGASRVLWLQDLTEQMPGMPINQGVHPRQVNVPWGTHRYVGQDAFGRLLGSMSPVGNDSVCFQRYRDLICVQPLTGEIQWMRKSAPMGCDLFGDDEMLFLAPAEGGEASVVRALDGELLGKRQVPSQEKRMATLGRLVLVWDTKDNHPVIALRDVWQQKDLWSRPLAIGSKAAVVGDEVVGLLEPSGKFAILNLRSGESIAEEKLEAEPSLMAIYLLRSRDQYVLVTSNPYQAADPNVNITPAPGGLNNPAISGRAYAFDNAGKPLWPKPVVIQQHGLVLTQPSELPILAFVRQIHRSSTTGQQDTKTSVMCIDKRTGRVVFHDDKLPFGINNFDIVGDHADNTVSLLLPGRTITMELTNKELPPAPAEQPGVPPKPEEKKGFSKTLEGVFKALGKAAEGLAPGDEPFDTDDD